MATLESVGRERLEPGDIDVLIAMPGRFDEPALLAAYDALMTDAERARQRAFVFERHRIESLVTRALVRTALSRYRPVAPEAWRFEKNEHGCPRIEPPCGLSFNLSNHPTMVVCAVTEGAAIGVDVEPLSRAPEIVEVAGDVFTPTEQAELATLGPEGKRDRAVTLWTLKEAYIKARSLGLALPLDGFAFRFDDPTRPRISFAASIDDDPARWWFHTVDVAEHRIALALERAPTPTMLDAEVRVRVRVCVPLREEADGESVIHNALAPLT